MWKRVLGVVALSSSVLAGAALAAHSRAAADPVMLNNPNPASFQVYGVQPAPKSVVDESVEGGRALVVPVEGKGEPWAVGINVPINKAIKKGDRIEVFYWAKLKDGSAGQSARIAAAQLQLNSAPYTTLFGEGATITPEWKLYQLKGVAPDNYPRNTLTASFHVNTGKHAVALGAVAVLNQGQ